MCNPPIKNFVSTFLWKKPRIWYQQPLNGTLHDTKPALSRCAGFGKYETKFVPLCFYCFNHIPWKLQLCGVISLSVRLSQYIDFHPLRWLIYWHIILRKPGNYNSKDLLKCGVYVQMSIICHRQLSCEQNQNKVYINLVDISVYWHNAGDLGDFFYYYYM